MPQPSDLRSTTLKMCEKISRFVADQRDHHSGTGVHPGLFQPLADLQERVPVGNTVNQHARRGSRIVRPGDRPERLLSGRVPNGDLDLPVVQRQRFVPVIHSYATNRTRVRTRIKYGGRVSDSV